MKVSKYLGDGWLAICQSPFLRPNFPPTSWLCPNRTSSDSGWKRKEDIINTYPVETTEIANQTQSSSCRSTFKPTMTNGPGGKWMDLYGNHFFWTSFHFFWTWTLFMDLTTILLEMATLLQKKGSHLQKNCSKVHEKCPGPKEMERGPKVFSITCAPSCWTCVPSFWTWPFPKPHPLWIDSPSCVLIAILQTLGG